MANNISDISTNHINPRKMGSVVNAIAQRFFAVYSVDIIEDTFIEIYSVKTLTKLIGKEGVASKSLEAVWQRLVQEEDKFTMQRMHDISSWKNYLNGRDIYSVDYRGITTGWCRASICAAERDENGMVTHVVYTLEKIHEQKEIEMMLEQQLREIKMLNDHLEETQAQLEEVAAEQESQVEELSILNEELEKAKHEAEAANVAKTLFLNNMSHDIRTPMNAILGFTDLMEKVLDKPEQAYEYLTKIRTSGEFLLSLINNVLDMASIESGQATVDETFYEMDRPHNSTIPLFEDMMRKKNIKFKVSMEAEHKYLLVDKMKVHQISMNLLSNAYKYTPEGGEVTFTMTEEPSDRPGYAKIVTRCTDTGIGMRQEYAEHIFDMFSRERNTTESMVMGTGLGMAIVKKLVDLLGGTIKVETEIGKGTTFTTIIYHKIVPNPDDYLEELKQEEHTDVLLEGKRILLTEDNELNAEIAIAVLEDMGIIVEHAWDGVECIKMLSNAEDGYYDLILMDIQMPNLNGYDTTRRIRKISNESKARIPIVAMTANAFDEDRRKAFDAGMNAHLAKPIDVAELMKTLSAVIGKVRG